MSFLLIALLSLVALGVVAALSSLGGSDEPIRHAEGDCASCTSHDDGSCKIACLMEEARQRKANAAATGDAATVATEATAVAADVADAPRAADVPPSGGSPSASACSPVSSVSSLLPFLLGGLLLVSCSTKKNTAQSRFWQSFTARYNTYYNGSQAFIDGSIEKETNHQDNYTELLPLYPVSSKASRSLGSAHFDRAIEKSEKAIHQHSIKARPEWNKSRRKTPKDREWLSRREYNPFLWRAWLLLGKSQFQKGDFEEAAATFSYMSRLYQSQPAIKGIARAWQAKSYVELDWLYDAEDVMTKQRRDTLHFRAQTDWDYTYADYYLRSGQYAQAVPYLRRVIGHERRRRQRAREWFILGQVQAQLGQRTEAYKAFRRVVRLNPPYELEFNARIAQTEVMADGTTARRMVSRLRRMTASDNNRDYLEQVYYAIGNIYLAQHDTLHAIDAYETGNRKATRSGIEKGVLLLTLGNLYWEQQRYGDAQRCYGEAIGLLDRDRSDYRQLAERSQLLDALAPHADAVQLQDSLQRLARMDEQQRNAVIDRLISQLLKREKEEQRAREAAAADEYLSQQASIGNRQEPTAAGTAALGSQQQNGLWYFYNPQAVSQGRQAFQQQWGRRDNVDNWQRHNLTVVSQPATSTDAAPAADDPTAPLADPSATPSADEPAAAPADSAALDPHHRDYYLAQIPLTSQQMEQSNALLADGLFHSGIIFKDRLDNLPLSERTLLRLVDNFPDYAHNDEALYHLYLLYARRQQADEAARMLNRMQQHYPASEWTVLLSDPHFAENQRFGVHIEDSLYAATYDAFKADRHDEVAANAQLAAARFPLGQHRPKFLLVEGLSLLNGGQADACLERLQQVVSQYPQSEVSELAGMIIRGVQQGRQLHGARFDVGDVWSRRAAVLAADSVQSDTLTFERQARYVFLLAYQPDSVSQNQLLYEMARHNFTSYLVRNFDIVTDQDPNGLCRMLVSGFLSYDEALQYARQLHTVGGSLGSLLARCRSLIVSERNLRLLGSAYSYRDYEVFFEQQVAPVPISAKPLLEEPEQVVQEEEPEPDAAPDADPDAIDDAEDLDLPAPPQPAPQQAAPQQPAADDDLFPAVNEPTGGYIEFDDDFFR